MKKWNLREAVDNLTLREKLWVEAFIRSYSPHLTDAQIRTEAANIRERALKQVFEIFPGGVEDTYYLASNFPTRENALRDITLDSINIASRDRNLQNRIDINVI